MTHLLLQLGHRFGIERGFLWPLGWLILLFFLALVALLAIGIVWAVRSTRRPLGSPPPRSDDAVAALRMRYARGEIDREEFVTASRDLGAPLPPGAPPS